MLILIIIVLLYFFNLVLFFLGSQYALDDELYFELSSSVSLLLPLELLGDQEKSHDLSSFLFILLLVLSSNLYNYHEAYSLRLFEGSVSVGQLLLSGCTGFLLLLISSLNFLSSSFSLRRKESYLF